MMFKDVLKPINGYSKTGIEQVLRDCKEYSIYLDNFNNVRLLKKNGSGDFIAGLHIERQKTKARRYKILTVYCTFKERRKGHCKDLYILASKLFKDIRHSEHLTKEGEKWAYSVS